MILDSGSKNKPGCSAGDSLPFFSGNVGTDSGKKYEPGGQSHSGLEAEGRLKGGVGGGAHPQNKVNTFFQVSELC